MDKRQLAETRRWASFTAEHGSSPELRAAGRAIVLLADEVDRLRTELAQAQGPREEETRPPRQDRPRRRRAFSGAPRARPRRRLLAPEEVPDSSEDPPLDSDPESPLEPRPYDAEGDDGPRRREVTARVPDHERPRREEIVAPPESRRRRRPPRRRGSALQAFLWRRRSRLAVVLVAAALALVTLTTAARIAAPRLDTAGPEPDARIGRAALDTLVFSVGGSPSTLAAARWRLDGADVTKAARRTGEKLVLRPARLTEGEHRLAVSADGSLPWSAGRHEWRFTIDTTPPAIRLGRPPRARARSAFTLTGTVEPGASLLADGRTVGASDGRFAVRYASPPARPVALRATDEAGNTATRHVVVEVVPRTPAEPVRAVHVTGYGWADDGLRQGVMDLLASHRINAIEIDLKDESGLVGFDPAVPLARRIGAARSIYDLAALIRTMHARGVRVIGRLVCFRDPILAAAAWKAGAREQVIQTPDGEPYAGYGGFTNFADPVVRRYQIDLAVAAARLGIDDVLYDYVRRPDGPTASMVFPGLRGTPERAIVSFLAETRKALAPYGTYLGASVFGVAATRPLEVAQDVPRLARQVDYVAPMVYPSHWGPGEYDVPDPNGEPYRIVLRSLRDFRRDVRGTGARVVPWLQDFSLGRTYGPGEVRAQITASRDAGSGEFILWDPAVTYTADALTPDAATSRDGLASPAKSRSSGPANRPRPLTVRATTTAPRAASEAAEAKANELGVVPVLMHHEIRPDRVGDYDQTPAEFRAELERLWKDGYRPVRAMDLVGGQLDVPAGKTPVVLTFDDSTKYQFSYGPDGAIKPDTAVGIMLAFAKSHPGFKPAGTFFPLREPFAGTAAGPAMLRWLVAHGFELGNHTKDHIPLGRLDATGVQRELALGQKIITDAVPGYRVRTMALPLGSAPEPASLALRGRWQELSYRAEGVFLVGAEPAHSPFSTGWDATAIPRIRSSHLPWESQPEFTAAYWLQELERHPEARYVSDGDPARISFPAAQGSQLAPRYRSRANPY